jgi:hypothetical protein
MIGHEHPPQRRAALALVGPRPPRGDRPATVRTIARVQGHIEPRPRTTREAVGGDRAWPGLAQGRGDTTSAAKKQGKNGGRGLWESPGCAPRG